MNQRERRPSFHSLRRMHTSVSLKSTDVGCPLKSYHAVFYTGCHDYFFDRQTAIGGIYIYITHDGAYEYIYIYIERLGKLIHIVSSMKDRPQPVILQSGSQFDLVRIRVTLCRLGRESNSDWTTTELILMSLCLFFPLKWRLVCSGT